MAKIIQEGNKHKIAICKECKCLFSYLSCEAYENRKHYYVNCPDCLCANIIEKKDEENIKKEA